FLPHGQDGLIIQLVLDLSELILQPMEVLEHLISINKHSVHFEFQKVLRAGQQMPVVELSEVLVGLNLREQLQLQVIGIIDIPCKVFIEQIFWCIRQITTPLQSSLCINDEAFIELRYHILMVHAS